MIACSLTAEVCVEVRCEATGVWVAVSSETIGVWIHDVSEATKVSEAQC